MIDKHCDRLFDNGDMTAPCSPWEGCGHVGCPSEKDRAARERNALLVDELVAREAGIEAREQAATDAIVCEQIAREAQALRQQAVGPDYRFVETSYGVQIWRNNKVLHACEELRMRATGTVPQEPGENADALYRWLHLRVVRWVTYNPSGGAATFDGFVRELSREALRLYLNSRPNAGLPGVPS